MKKERWPTTAIVIICVLVILLIGQKMRHDALLKRIDLYRARVSTVDDKTGDILDPIVSGSGGVDNETVFYNSIGGTVFEWVSVEPQTIYVSAQGYETQTFVVSSRTNVLFRLKKLSTKI